MTAETYDDLKKYVGSKDNVADDLFNMGYDKGYNKGREEITELRNNTIKSIKEIKKWYINVYKDSDVDKVPIRTILYDLSILIKELEETSTS